MNKTTATLIVLVLFPVYLPIAIAWLCFIAASRVTELWYRAWEVLRQ